MTISLSDRGVHALSFFFIMISISVVNAVWVVGSVTYLHDAPNWQMLGIVDLVAFAGLSYYGANVTFNPQSGVTVDTKGTGP